MNQRARWRIGTRGSPLALIQTDIVRDALVAAHPSLAGAVEVVVIKTTGDKFQDRALSEVGGKGMFTKEIDEALLDGRIDLAMHSVKDLPTALPEGIVLPSILAREDPRDVFVSLKFKSLGAMPAGARVGSASLRRQAQVLHRHPGLKATLFRGNVNTRLKKLEAGEAEATILAMAGLIRLGRTDVATEVLEPEVMLPAVGQGALAVTCRADDAEAKRLLTPLNDDKTSACVAAERAMLAVLDGSCRTPIAGYAELAGRTLRLRGLVASPDGARVFTAERTGDAGQAPALGREVGRELRSRAIVEVFKDIG
ncbi:MAG: hydroxymethylbilane synthase [Rhodospirillales bacterium]|nr:hydroxymethylbilane synthase [Rhodospirillales bacterium]